MPLLVPDNILVPGNPIFEIRRTSCISVDLMISLRIQSRSKPAHDVARSCRCLRRQIKDTNRPLTSTMPGFSSRLTCKPSISLLNPLNSSITAINCRIPSSSNLSFRTARKCAPRFNSHYRPPTIRQQRKPPWSICPACLVLLLK